MKHLYRFYGKKSVHSHGHWILDPDEMEHAAKVVRIKQGDSFEIFDGEGHLARAVATSVHKNQLEFSVTEEFNQTQELYSFEIAIGALKPATYDDLLPPLVELGVSRILLFPQEHVSKDRLSQKNLDRFQKIMISASKQSKRLWLPKIEVANDLSHVISSLSDLKFVLLPGSLVHLGDAIEKSRLARDISAPISVGAIIGGEKGFSPLEELQLKDIPAVSLGVNILRSWTAAVVAAAHCAKWQFEMRVK